MGGAFDDANKFHQQYMEDFIDKDSLFRKTLSGSNAHEIMDHLSNDTFAEQARRTMVKYEKYGVDPRWVDKEGRVFQKLKAGLPRQLGVRPFEVIADIPTAG